jgi:hypothetical protein
MAVLILITSHLFCFLAGLYINKDKALADFKKVSSVFIKKKAKIVDIENPLDNIKL